VIALDTNVLVRLVTRDDEEQVERARAALEGQQLFVAKTVLLETEWVLRFSYGLPRETIRAAFENVLGLRGLLAEDRSTVLLALAAYERGLDLADALHLASSAPADRFATFDILDNLDSREAAAAAEDLLARLAGGQVVLTGRLSSWSGRVEALELDVLGEEEAVEFLLARTDKRRRKAAADDAQARPILNVHRLVQDVTRRSQAGELGVSTLTEALGWINDAFDGDPEDVRAWPTLDPLAPHARAIADYADQAAIAEPTTRLVSDLGTLLVAKARYIEAEPLMRRALAIDEHAFGPDHPNVAIRLNNLAQVLHDTNRLSEAEPLLRQALTIDEEAHGPEDPDIGTCLNNLAVLLKDTNRLSEAEGLLRRAVTIKEEAYGPEDPEVAEVLVDLAHLLRLANRPGEAEPLIRRALAIDEHYFEQDDPNIARDLSALALAARSGSSTARPGAPRAGALHRRPQGTAGRASGLPPAPLSRTLPRRE
jgi:predicted nucleic-acid-binding protein